MLTGKIKHLERSKGWGFIESEDGDDYFFNVSSVRPGQDLRLGDSVKFENSGMSKREWEEFTNYFEMG